MLYLRTGGYASSSDYADPTYPQVWYRPLWPLIARRWPRGRWVTVKRGKKPPLVRRLPKPTYGS